MRMPTRQRPASRSGGTTLPRPDVAGTARVARRTRDLLGRLRPGDLAVVEHVDLDRATAQALVDAGVSALLNVAPMTSGRFANLGPELLVASGVHVVDSLGPSVLGLADRSRVEIRAGAVWVDGVEVATGRRVDAEVVAADMTAARSGLLAQVETFTTASTELLRREQDLLLHGRGVPRPATRIEGRPVVVVVPGPGHQAELRAVRRYLREADPVLVAVDEAATTLTRARLRPHVVVVSAGAELPASRVLRAARDVVVLAPRGSGRATTERVERLGIAALLLETGASGGDAALLLAHHRAARLVVAVGLHASLDDLLDRRSTGQAGSHLTRLALGPRLVDARAVPDLYSGRVRARHLVGVALSGGLALLAAIGVTPAGQEWGIDPVAWLGDLTTYVQGKLP